MRQANGLDEFYSRTMGNDSCELFVDKYGDPTCDYPHVHIVHHGNGNVDIVASLRKGHHIQESRTMLKNPDGNQVNAAVYKARSYL